MKSKKLIMVAAAIFLSSPSVYAQTSGAQLFEAKCASCHVKTRPDDISTLVAPPIMGVARHVKMTYRTKKEAVNFITDYVLDPQESKAVCMPDKLKHFGLMPSQKGLVTKEELVSIAGWIYDNFGNQGQGFGRGKACQEQ